MKSMPKIKRSKQSLWLRYKGFTLIELMVVIAIIGVLSVVFVNVSTQNLKRSRDARRYTDLTSIEAALELYKADHNNYPTTALAWHSVCNGFATSGANGYVPNLAPQYLTKLPTDPSGCVGNGTVKGYIYMSDGTDYKVATDMGAEIGDKCAPGGDFADYRDTAQSHLFCSIYTAGAANW